MFEYVQEHPWRCVLIALASIVLYLTKKHFNGGVCKIEGDLAEKIVVVTGASSGIGRETARYLASLGATVILACRSREKALPVIEDIKMETNNERVEFMELDLGDTESIMKFAFTFQRKYKSLDVLVNNAGVYLNRFEMTSSGHETNFGTNHIGHFQLTNFLLQLLEKTPNSRVITVASDQHFKSAPLDFDRLNDRKSFDAQGTYAASKLANVLFAQELQRRLAGKLVKSVSVNPGLARTDLLQHYLRSPLLRLLYVLLYPIIWLVTKDSMQGAQTTLHCVLVDWKKLVGGAYYSECDVKEVSPLASEQVAKELWDYSLNSIGVT